jgi:hypothetical protein
MRDYTKLSDYELLFKFSYAMVFNIDDVGKSVKELTDSWPNDFWRIYREIEHRGIYKRSEVSKFIGIIGSRRRDEEEDFDLIHKEFQKLWEPNKDIVIVSGLCPQGGDRFATILYQKYRTRKLWFPAEWHIGRHAGFVRNTEVARWSDYLIATPAPDRKGGTEDTIKKFTRFHEHDKLVIT